MKHLRVPSEISSHDVRRNSTSLSASMYQKVVLPNTNTMTVRELIVGYDKGVDPGSLHYLNRSTHQFIRTKALQSEQRLLSAKGGAITPINPRVFEQLDLNDGDILISKDSNIGECAMIDGNGWARHMLSGGLVRLRLRPETNLHYLFAFLKHPLFKTELISKVPRGSTIAHANELWLDCRIPFPDQGNAQDIIAYVAALSEAIIDKEKAIRARNAGIFTIIDRELDNNQTGVPFTYNYPTLADVRQSYRLDTGLYCIDFRRFEHRVANYRLGQTTLSKMGVRSRRGPNLAVSIIGKSLYSDVEKAGWYELIRPVNIGEYGTLSQREWLGTRKTLPIVKAGDLILGCEGFEKGRSIVMIEAPERCTTNFHGTVLSWPNSEIWQVVFVRCFLAYLREHGIIDLVGVGGSGGHMSPEYFDYLPFPCFPDDVQQDISRLYHNPVDCTPVPRTLEGFVVWHRSRNTDLGIWELDRERLSLQRELTRVQDAIIEGEAAALPF